MRNNFDVGLHRPAVQLRSSSTITSLVGCLLAYWHDMSGASSRAMRPGPHPCAMPWPCTTARAQVPPRDCLPVRARPPPAAACSASARQSNGGRFPPGPGQRMSRTTSYYVLSLHPRRACTCHDAQARGGQAWAGPLGSRRWLPNPRHAPCQLHGAGRVTHRLTCGGRRAVTMTPPPSVSTPSTETSADLHLLSD